MPGPEGYILSFDFNEITRNISDLQKQYVDLSNTFKSFSEDSEKFLDNLVSRINVLSSSLDASFQKLNAFYSKPLGNVEYISKYFENISKYSKSIVKSLTTLGSVDITKAFSKVDERGKVPAGLTIPSAAVGGSDFALQMSLAAKEGEKAEETIQRAEKALASARRALEESKEASGKMLNFIKTEAGNAKGAISGIMGNVPGVVGFGGGFLGGLIGLMILGEQQKQRKGAEAAEMTTAVATAGGVFEKGTKNASAQLARFAEEAQFQFGIGRKEIQGIVNQVANAGIKITDKMVPVSKSFEDVHANVFSTSIALDKLFKLSSGTSMQRSLELVREYGMSIESATSKMVKLSFAAQSSGMDIQRFTGAVLSGSSTLAQYGFEMGDVAQMLQTIKKRYADLGIDPHKGGELAARSVEAISRGLTSLPEGIQLALARRMYPELTAQAGKVRMAEELMSGEKEKRAIAGALYIKSFYDLMKEQSGTDKSLLVEMVRQTLGFSGLEGVNQARDFIAMAEKFRAGQALKDLSPEQKKLFEDTFKREGAQLSDFQKMQRRLIDNMAKIGQGLLQVTSALMASIITGFRSLTIAIGAAGTLMNPLSSKAEKASANQSLAIIQGKFSEIYGVMEKGSNNFIEGVSGLGDVLGKKFGEMFKPVMDSLKADYRSDLQKEIDERAEKIERRIDTELSLMNNKIAEIMASIVLKGHIPVFGKSVSQMAAGMATDDELRAKQAAEADKAAKVKSADFAQKYLDKAKKEEENNKPYLNVFPGTVQGVIPNSQVRQVVQTVLDSP